MRKNILFVIISMISLLLGGCRQGTSSVTVPPTSETTDSVTPTSSVTVPSTSETINSVTPTPSVTVPPTSETINSVTPTSSATVPPTSETTSDVTPTPSGNQGAARLDHPFELKVGQAAAIASSGLVVRFEAVTEDSRCPVDAECAWEGRVRVAGSISRQDEQLHAFSLTLYGRSHRSTDESSQTFDSYSISFVNFQPEPLLEPTGDDLPRPEETATFMVSLVAPKTETDSSYELVTTDEFEGVIFSQDVGSGLIPATGYWTASKKHVLALEAAVESYLQEFPDERSPDLWQKLPEYKRQYVGIIEEGRQKIYGNFFCNTFGEWKKDPILVDDGGDCYFQLKYEVETGTFSDLYINGES